MMLKNNENEIDLKAAMLGPSTHRMLDHIHMNDDDEEDDEEEGEEDEYMNGPIKVRDHSPSMEGGYWMTATGGNNSIDSATTCPASESGFISSQPSMAEFILPHHIADGMQTEDMSPGNSNPAALYGAAMQDSQSNSINVQEYPWMKEKKTSRKNNHQGESQCIFC
ncbi:hypothetical protein V9T40_012820 [Parthenolecanium corni]|uniref:Uncharacterized protein n=1 Tax=Parthenolecanium corni TaxID=536013 RepID=A0AAN9T9G9_9HEMI